MHKNFYSNTAYEIDGEPGYYGVGTVGGATASGPSCHIWSTHKANAPVDETTQDAQNSEPFFNEETGEPRFVCRCDTTAMATALTAKLNEDDSWIFAAPKPPAVKSDKTDLRTLALDARAAQIVAIDAENEARERAKRRQRERHQPAAQNLVVAELRTLCQGTVPRYEIEWTGEGAEVSAKVHLGTVVLSAYFRSPEPTREPIDCQLSYYGNPFANLAELGALIKRREEEESTGLYD